MPEIITLKVRVDEGTSAAAIEKYRQFAKEMNHTVIKPKVDLSGIQQTDTVIQSRINLLTGVTRETSNINKQTSMFGKLSKEAFKQYSSGVINAEQAVQGFTKNIKDAQTETQKTGDSIGALSAKVLKWAAATTLIYAPIRAFREALTTLKEVDGQLVSIQKVTDMTREEMDALTDSAYALASQMGRTADEVLNASVTFARAGYGEQIEQLSELSVLVQNVGDVESDTASEFLLAVDAAWKLNGSYSDLIEVVDGLNEITNRNATDMDKMTSGITVAASVFASAGESAQTFAAMLGTATAATQRSGSEMARGLRTIAMNIRQIRGETEDGELIDGESIANAAKALQQYAGISTMTNGQLRLTSDVLGELAGKWETLDTVAQSAVAEALAGKRQANILTALMSNWDKYEKMMQDYAEGAGSALKENEIYLESWEAKSKQLSAAWTEFVSHLVDSDAIKAGLDVMIAFVEVLDSAPGKAALMVAALGALAVGADALKNKVEKLNFAMLKNPIFLAISGTTIGVAAIISIFDAISTTLEEQKEIVQDLTTEVNNLQSEYDQLLNNPDRTEAEERRLKILQLELDTQKELLELEKKKQYQMEWGSQVATTETQWTYDSMGNQVPASMSIVYKDRAEVIREQIESYSAVEAEAQKAWDAVEGLTYGTEEYAEAVEKAAEADEEAAKVNADKLDLITQTIENLESYGDLLGTSERELLEWLYLLVDQEYELSEAMEESSNSAASWSVAEKSHIEILAEVKENVELLRDAQEELNENNVLSADTAQKLIEKYPELADQLTLTENGYILTKNALDDLIQSQIQQYGMNDQAQESAQNAINAQAEMRGYIIDTTLSIWDQVYALQALYATEKLNEGWTRSEIYKTSQWQDYASILASYENAQRNEKKAEEVVNQLMNAPRSSSSGGSSRSSAKQEETDPFQEMKDALDDTLNDMEHQIFLWEKQGNMSEAIINQYRAMQQKVHELAQYYRSQGLDENSEYIQALQKQWWSYEDSISSMQNALLDELKTAVNEQLERAQEARDRELEALDAELAKLEESRRLEEEKLTLQEKQLAVEEARKALLDAQNERTIRRLQNGVWEWVADEETVRTAQDAYADAKKELRDYQEDLAYNAAVEEINARKEAINAAYDTIEESWERIIESMESPSREISEILNDIADYGAPLLQQNVNSINALLGSLSNYMAAVVGTSTGGSVSGGSKDYKNDATDYSKLMLNASSAGEFSYWAGERDKKAAAQGIDYTSSGYRDNSTLFNEWKKTHTFDSGGILQGIGGIKATAQNEAVLSPEMTERILSPVSNERFTSFANALGLIFGSAEAFASQMTAGNRYSSITDSHAVNYYINGVKIGQDMAQQPLSTVLSTLKLYTN